MICDLFICSILCQLRPEYKQLCQILVCEPVCACEDWGPSLLPIKNVLTIARLSSTECCSR